MTNYGLTNMGITGAEYTSMLHGHEVDYERAYYLPGKTMDASGTASSPDGSKKRGKFSKMINYFGTTVLLWRG